MRNMSFFATQQQVRDRTKNVTRRNGWDFLKVDDQVMAVEKAQGLKKGEKIVKITPIQIISTRFEPLRRMIDEPEYGEAEVIREGFPDMSPAEFVAMYCKMNKCNADQQVNRIEFFYIDTQEVTPPKKVYVPGMDRLPGVYTEQVAIPDNIVPHVSMATMGVPYKTTLTVDTTNDQAANASIALLDAAVTYALDQNTGMGALMYDHDPEVEGVDMTNMFQAAQGVWVHRYKLGERQLRVTVAVYMIVLNDKQKEIAR